MMQAVGFPELEAAGVRRKLRSDDQRAALHTETLERRTDTNQRLWQSVRV